MSSIIGILSDIIKVHVSRIFEFIDPVGSTELQTYNNIQASSLTLCQYYSKYGLLFDQFLCAH